MVEHLFVKNQNYRVSLLLSLQKDMQAKLDVFRRRLSISSTLYSLRTHVACKRSV